jgi:hypothetical protein
VSEPKDEAKSPLSRWSERKLAARRGEALDEPAAEAPSVETSPPVEAASPAEPATESEAPALPAIDELDFQSDYTAFLTKNVPEALRRAALRKLWASDPVLANLDGLNDYDEDFNVVDQVISLAQSGYQPGLGYLDEAEKKLAQIDQTLGGGDGIPDSHGTQAPAGRVAANDAPSDNAAANAEPVDAARRSSVIESEQPAPEPAKDSDK